MLFWVFKIHLREYGGILLTDPYVEKYFGPFNLEKISPTFGMGQINFCVILLSAQ